MLPLKLFFMWLFLKISIALWLGPALAESCVLLMWAKRSPCVDGFSTKGKRGPRELRRGYIAGAKAAPRA